VTHDNILVMNLDPAAEHFKYKVDIDTQELITVQDVMETYSLGPNGGLLKALD